MANDVAYNDLKKTLDLFRDVELAEFELIELHDPSRSDEQQETFAKFVRDALTEVLVKIADRQREEWGSLINAHPEKFKGFSKEGICPPGFHDEGGTCRSN